MYSAFEPLAIILFHASKVGRLGRFHCIGVILGLSLLVLPLANVARAVSPAPDGGYAGFNTAEGDSALNSLTTGISDTALGYNALFNNTTGERNTATGSVALTINTTGSRNTATGNRALESNSTGNDNTAVGFEALDLNNANNNTAVGADALALNSSGTNNTATGFFALLNNSTGNGNTAAGANALEKNTTGSFNTAHGWRALQANQTANFNAALGPNALAANRGNSNAAFGVNSLFHNTTGIGNIAMGFQAGLNLTTGNNNIDIGNFGVAGEGYTIRIGTAQNRTFIAGIRGAVVPGGTAVYVNSNGQLGTTPSSQRFKSDIAPMTNKSEAILSLHPVTFRYKDKLDPNRTAQFGLIAEEVAKVNPDLVTRDEKGEVYSVRYEAINAMLLNEFLKEHAKVEEQEAKLAAQQKEIDALRATIQRVSDQIQLSQPAPQLAANEN